jgi:hypothetical protein
LWWDLPRPPKERRHCAHKSLWWEFKSDNWGLKPSKHKYCPLASLLMLNHWKPSLFWNTLFPILPLYPQGWPHHDWVHSENIIV